MRDLAKKADNNKCGQATVQKTKQTKKSTNNTEVPAQCKDLSLHVKKTHLDIKAGTGSDKFFRLFQCEGPPWNSQKYYIANDTAGH